MYGDEKIIKERTQLRMMPKSLDGEFFIEERAYHFSSREVVPGKVLMSIPTEFELMPLETAKTKYLSDSRPDYIYTNLDGSTNLTFSLLEEPLFEDQIYDTAHKLRAVIKRIYPANTFSDIRPFYSDSKLKIGKFEYTSFAIDADLFNAVFVTAIEQKLLLGGFNCLFALKTSWKPLLTLMLRTLESICEVNLL